MRAIALARQRRDGRLWCLDNSCNAHSADLDRLLAIADDSAPDPAEHPTS
ncbi:hypothetical protein [Mycobacterium asiaticum]|nr:hypothetical protein [Mycobacterium asiaticum]